MNTFLGFLVIAVVVVLLAYFKVPAFKAFVDSKIKKPAQNAVDVIKAPFRASDTDVATPTPTPMPKPVVEPVRKPEAPVDAPSTDAYRVKPGSPEQAAMDSRGQGQFGPLPPPVEVAPTQILSLTSGVRVEVVMKKDQKVRLLVISPASIKRVQVTGSEGGYDAAFTDQVSNSKPIYSGAFGSGIFYTDAAGYVEVYASKDCKAYFE